VFVHTDEEHRICEEHRVCDGQVENVDVGDGLHASIACHDVNDEHNK